MVAPPRDGLNGLGNVFTPEISGTLPAAAPETSRIVKMTSSDVKFPPASVAVRRNVTTVLALTFGEKNCARALAGTAVTVPVALMSVHAGPATCDQAYDIGNWLSGSLTMPESAVLLSSIAVPSC